MERFAAKLLFQFRVGAKVSARERLICEERIILFEARNAKSALSKAQQRGKKDQFDYKTADGEKVYFEFVGIQDFRELGTLCEADEVWYEIRRYQSPMRRRSKFIPSDKALLARS